MSIRRTILKLVSMAVSTDVSKIVSILDNDNVEIVSFDIFDTLIKRNVGRPKDVFKILEKEYNNQYKEKRNIYKLRVDAEKKAILLAKSEDINLNDIYMAMSEIPEDKKQWLEKREIELELKVCQRNNAIWKVYEWCKKHKKKIIFTSDMYLSNDVIKKILFNAGYDYYDKLYVSSEYGLRKSSGNLYKMILNDLSASAFDMMHIGDSFVSDYWRARKIGIGSILIKREEILSNSLEESVLKSFIQNNINNNGIIDYYENVGYTCLGPLLYGFSKWLEDISNKNNIQKLFFLTREGALLKRAYDIIGSIEDTYILSVSRRATVYPLLYKAETLEEFILLLFNGKFDVSVNELLVECDIDKDEIGKLCREINVCDKRKVKELDDNEKNFFWSYIKKWIEPKSKAQEENLKNYLELEKFQGRLAIVDVGWNGTIQAALEKMNTNSEILGLYLGLKGNKVNRALGFLFDNNNEQVMNEIMFSLNLFETLFLSTHGTIVKYEKVENVIVPIEGKQEQNSEGVQIVQRIQEQALRFVKEFDASKLDSIQMISPLVFYENYQKIVNPPKMSLIQQFNKLRFVNIDYSNMIINHTPLYYWTHPIKLVNDFKNSTCKMLFLKAVCIVPIPYFKILCFFKKYRE